MSEYRGQSEYHLLCHFNCYRSANVGKVAFIDFKLQESAAAAIDQMNGSTVGTSVLKVAYGNILFHETHLSSFHSKEKVYRTRIGLWRRTNG